MNHCCSCCGCLLLASAVCVKLEDYYCLLSINSVVWQFIDSKHESIKATIQFIAPCLLACLLHGREKQQKRRKHKNQTANNNNKASKTIKR